MNRRRILFFAMAGAAAAFLCGCQSSGGLPAGQSAVAVYGHSLTEIQTKAEEVFYRHGFDFKSLGNDQMIFERKGGALDNILYGNWQDNDTLTRVTLYIVSEGENAHRLTARSEVIRKTFGFDDAKQYDLQGARYGVILKKIAQELQ